MEHAETREGFELERVVSCGRSEQRWRAKLDLGSSEALEVLRVAAEGGTPEAITQTKASSEPLQTTSNRWPQKDKNRDDVAPPFCDVAALSGDKDNLSPC